MKKNKSSVLVGFVLFSLAAFSIPTSAADLAAGKSKAIVCTSCHGANGISISPDIPNLAGQKALYLAKAIRDYKSGERKNGMMSAVVGTISDADIENISAYFSSLK